MSTDQTNALAAYRAPSASEPPLDNNFYSGGYSFILETPGKDLQEVYLIVNPEEYSKVSSSTSNVILTAGDVFEDSFGPGLSRVSMSGTFGHRPYTNGAQSSGQYQLLHLANLFDTYLDLLNPIITQDPFINSNSKLSFYNHKDGDYYQIVLLGDFFVLKRSKSAPFLYRYELNFTCMSRLTVDLGFDPQSIRSQVLEVLQDNTAALTDTINSLTSDIVLATTTVQQLGYTENYLANNILAPLTNLSSAVSDFLAAGSQVIDYQLSDIAALKNTCQTLVSAQNYSYALYLSGNNTGFTYDQTLDNNLISTILILDKYLLYSNSFVKQFIKSDFSTQTSLYDPNLVYVDLGQIKSVQYYTIKQGDTIEAIALSTLGSTDNWKTLAEFNNLNYPYITDDKPQPEKTLGPGQKIAIPITQFGSLATNLILGSYITNPSPGTPGTNPDANNSTFGTDFYLDQSGNLEFVPSTSSGTIDLQTISGLPEFLQGIRIKLNTVKNELLAHPNYGMFDLKGYRTLPLMAARAKAELQSTILSDSRVKSVNVTVNVQDDILKYETQIFTNFQAAPSVLSGQIASA